MDNHRMNAPFSRDEAHNYWRQRHKTHDAQWQAVGFKGGDRSLNDAFYRCRTAALKRILARFGSLVGRTVLDVGCGLGHFSRIYSELGAHVTGIDVSADAISHCNSLAIGKFVQTSISDLRTKIGGRFDIIHCFDVLYHVTDEDEWRGALRTFAELSHENTTWLLTEFQVRRHRRGEKHVVKRTIAEYESQLLTYKRRIVSKVPLYWLYWMFPSIAKRWPSMVYMLDPLGPIAAPFLREKAALWTVRTANNGK
jgi:2-polyprenyl-3-methyl-5-hydroxy-6-metoxy-1,4-benzoquinol methylase